MAFVQALVVALVALILAPGYLFYFDITPKIIVLLVGTAVTLVAAAFSGVRISGRSKWFLAFSLLLIVYLGSLALSTAMSTRPDLSLFGSNWRRFGSLNQAVVFVFAWFVAANCAGNPQSVKTILRGVAAAGALSAAYGIAQYFGWDPLLPASAYHVGEGIWTIVRPPGTLGYASYFATWLLFVVFLSLALRTFESSPAGRWFALGSAVLALAALLLTGTRAAVLGLLAGAIAWMAVRRVRIPRAILVAGALAVAGGVIFYFSPPGQLMRARMRWFEDDPWGGARVHLWRDSLRMAAHRLPAGYGPEVFTAEFPAFESDDLAKAYPNFSHESPHNIFLDALAGQGLPGLLLLLGLCGVGLAAAFRSNQALMAAALAGGIVSQQFTAFILPTALIFWTTLAIVIARVAPAVEWRRWRLEWVGATAAGSAALVFLATRLAISDGSLERARQELDRGNLANAVERYRQYESSRLPGASADIWYSRALLGLGSKSPKLEMRVVAFGQARGAALRATQTAEDPFDAWYNLAILCGAQNNPACVERSLRQAIAADPMWFKPHWALARILRLTGRMEEAEREAARALELDGGKDSEVAQTYQEIRDVADHARLFQK